MSMSVLHRTKFMYVLKQIKYLASHFFEYIHIITFIHSSPMDISHYIQQHFENKHTALLGYGTEWKSTLNFLLEQGIAPQYITILDKNEIDNAPSGIHCITWASYMQTLQDYNCIIRSPGLTNTKIIENIGHTWFTNIREKLTSQTQIFLDIYQGTIIWVTWTKGKSTTVSFLSTLLGLGKKSVILAWNIGTPILDRIEEVLHTDIVIYEFSSYMLEALDKPFKISYGILTSLWEAHVWAHGGITPYIQSKCKILTHSTYAFISHQAYTSAYLPQEIKELVSTKIHQWSAKIYGSTWDAYFKWETFFLDNEHICTDQTFRPLGTHMRENVSVGLLLLTVSDLKIDHFVQALWIYKPLPHRLQDIGTFAGVQWINDSFATTAHSVAACITTLWKPLQTIFVWGYDNDADPAPIVEAIQKSSIKNIILFPTTGPRLRAALWESYTYLETNDITQAVQRAYTHTTPWHSAALSCGYPSFTMRNNYVHRGENFSEVVRNIGNTID